MYKLAGVVWNDDGTMTSREFIDTEITYDLGTEDHFKNVYVTTEEWMKIKKKFKALEIINNKNVCIHDLKKSKTLEEYNCCREWKEELTQEEYNLLKEVLTNDI